MSTILRGSDNFDTASTPAQAWINFDGTAATIAIAKARNVSSLTDNGTGDYTVNFTSAMADATYAVTTGVARLASGLTRTGTFDQVSVTDLATGSFRMLQNNGGGTAVDLGVVTAGVFD